MPTFDFPTLAWWGLPLVAAPLLIHLINLLRHRTVRFAALEFLLESRRKYRTRVLLRQILLLALRTAAVLGLVLALARPRTRDALAGLLGAAPTLHVVLLDDSGSMAETRGAGGAETPFDRGRAAVERLAAELAAVGGRHELALATFSALAAGDPGADAWAVPRRTLAPDAVPAVRGRLDRLRPGHRATGPEAPLAAAAGTLAAAAPTPAVLWLVSDFRAKDWRASADAAEVLRRIADGGATLRLVDCAAPNRVGNLTLERLDAVGGVAAAGAAVTCEVEVRNDGEAAVRDVLVSLREDGAPRPGVQLAEIAPGGSATARFDVRFTAAGRHVLEAALPPDALADDDARAATIDVADRVDVLLIDGDPRGGSRADDAFYVAAALAPGAGAPTGLRPRIEPPRALSRLDLDGFSSVWVLDVERLDDAEIEPLERFAAAGGGVVFFTGPRTSVEAFNGRLHRDGVGLFPVPLAGSVERSAPVGEADAGPDVVVGDHPVVAVLAGQRNPLLDAVRIDRSFAVTRGHEEAPGLRRILSLRSGAPLAVEKPFGRGLVVAVLTSAAPTWNTWARGNPAWVVAMLELEAHLARGRRRAEGTLVGEPLVVPLDPAVDGGEVDVAPPGDGPTVRCAPVATPTGGLEAVLPTTDVPGIHVARWGRRDGSVAERPSAVNVDPVEGRLEPVGRERLARGLAGIPAEIRDAAAVDLDPGAPAAALSLPLLALVAAALLAEQLVALAAGCHGGLRSALGAVTRRPVAAR